MAEMNDAFLTMWASKMVEIMRQQDHQQQQSFPLQQAERQAERQTLHTPLPFDITSILNSPMSQPPPSPQPQQIVPSPLCYTQTQSPDANVQNFSTVASTTVCVTFSADLNNVSSAKSDQGEDAEDDIFSDSNEGSDSDDSDDPRQLWNDENKKKEYEELKRQYTKHNLRLCNKNGTIIKTVKIYSQNKNNFPVLVYDKRSYDAIYNLSKSLKEKLDLKAKIIQEIYNINQGINYVKYSSEQRGKRMRSIKRRKKEK